TLFSIFTGGLVDCHMPDGKTIKAPKKDCDAVNEFWNKHKPSNPGPSGNSGGESSNNNSNNNSGGGSSNNNGGMEITSAQVMPCTSTSCGSITTVKIIGSGFNPSSRIVLALNGITIGENTSFYSSPDATLTGGNGSTMIIMDFYNLPSCTTFRPHV